MRVALSRAPSAAAATAAWEDAGVAAALAAQAEEEAAWQRLLRPYEEALDQLKQRTLTHDGEGEGDASQWQRLLTEHETALDQLKQLPRSPPSPPPSLQSKPPRDLTPQDWGLWQGSVDLGGGKKTKQIKLRKTKKDKKPKKKNKKLKNIKKTKKKNKTKKKKTYKKHNKRRNKKTHKKN